MTPIVTAPPEHVTTRPLPSRIAEPLKRSWTESESFAYCRQLTRSHYENFPVGSILMPATLQPAIHSLYAFMRTADDFSDEDRRDGDDAERLSWLATWQAMLSECERGDARHPIFIALRSTLQTYKLPVSWLRDLLHAFEMDVSVRRYATEEDLFTYCRYSANPVGRLILTLFGYRDEERYRLSDAVCTGLQLANHWQDVGVDLEKNRIYLPQEHLQRFGVTEEQLFETRRSSLPESENIRRLLAFETERAWQQFRTGWPLPSTVKGRLRWELRLTWHGGTRILEKIQIGGYQTVRHRPALTRMDAVLLALRTVLAN